MCGCVVSVRVTIYISAPFIPECFRFLSDCDEVVESVFCSVPCVVVVFIFRFYIFAKGVLEGAFGTLLPGDDKTSIKLPNCKVTCLVFLCVCALSATFLFLSPAILSLPSYLFYLYVSRIYPKVVVWHGQNHLIWIW